jgi:hypothetical protein
MIFFLFYDYVIAMDISRNWRLKTSRAQILAGHGNPEMFLPFGVYEEQSKMDLYELDEFGNFILAHYLINRVTGKWTKKDGDE